MMKVDSIAGTIVEAEIGLVSAARAAAHGGIGLR